MIGVDLLSLLWTRRPSTAYLAVLVRKLERENGKLIVSYSDDTDIPPRRCRIERELKHIDRLRRHYRWKY